MKRKDFLFGAGAALSGSLLSSVKSIFDRFPDNSIARIIPPRLRPGDRVAFSAPAGRLYDLEDLRRMERVMNRMGLDVVFGKNVRQRHGYFAGTDKERADDLNRFFNDPNVHAVIAVRGGWGCNRILPMLDFEALKKNPKIICGFSDITSLHLAIWKSIGLVTYHGPNGTSDWTTFTREAFMDTVFHGEWNQPIKIPGHERYHFNRIYPGKAEGALIGGNLTLLASLAGTPYMPNLNGTILFLEDIGEEIYRIDRLLTQLRLSGVFDQINGLVFGRCSNCSMGPGASLTLETVLKEHLKPYSIPSFYGAMISHEPDNLTLPIGINSVLDAEQGTLRLLEEPVG